MKAFRLAVFLVSLLTMLPMSAWYYDPDGVENPLDSDITENVRYVTYECKNARFAEIPYSGRLDWHPTTACLKVIYCEDGTVYLNQFLNSIAITSDSRGSRKYWIKGNLSDDGKYIKIPVGQIVAADHYVMSQYFYPVIFSASENDNKITIDDSIEIIYLSIEEDNSLIPIGIDDTHGWGCLQECDNGFDRVLFCNAFVPTEEQPVLPPPGLVKEDFDFKFATFEGKVKFGDIGKRVKVVFHNDSIFIQGISYANTEGWSLGRKDGDTYVFENGKQPVRNVCLNAVDYSTLGDSFIWSSAVSTINSDVIFDTTPTQNSLVARSPFWLYGLSGGMAYNYDSYEYSYCDNDIYISGVFNKIPDGLQRPLPPYVSIEKELNEECWITVLGSYFDSNGFVMDVKKLFYKLYIDGIPYKFSKIERWNPLDLAEPTELLPYHLLNVSIEGKDEPSQYELNVNVPSTFKEVKAELVYIQDGQEISSGIDSIYAESNKTDKKDDIYDLTGRKVNPNALLPGIYIKGGHKFIVK